MFCKNEKPPSIFTDGGFVKWFRWLSIAFTRDQEIPSEYGAVVSFRDVDTSLVSIQEALDVWVVSDEECKTPRSHFADRSDVFVHQPETVGPQPLFRKHFVDWHT